MLPSPLLPNRILFKKSTILVIGDHDCGKSTFLKTFCKEFCDKKSSKSSSKINIYMKRQIIERAYTSNGEPDSIKYAIEFIELCGEKPYKDAMAFYVSQLLVLCSSIIFFFDLANKKSLFNFYMWIKFLIEAWEDPSIEHPLWKKPFLVCAGKRNLINQNQFDIMKGEIEDYFKSLFNCASGENIIYLGKNHKKFDFNELFLESFLNQICIELELNKIMSKKEKYAEDNVVQMDLSLMKGDLKKYYLNKEVVLKNLFANTFAKETMANLYWQFINQMWSYHKNLQRVAFNKVKGK